MVETLVEIKEFNRKLSRGNSLCSRRRIQSRAQVRQQSLSRSARQGRAWLWSL